MTIQRTQTGDVEVKVTVYRDGKKLQNASGNSDIGDFISGLEIYESITSATLEAKLILADSGGFLGLMTGSELFRIQIIGSVMDKTYYMRAYEIESRSRFNNADTYIINCATNEFFKNEVTNVFGNSQQIFSGDLEASAIVKKILRDKRYLQTKKKLFLEETINKQQFIAPNWRAFDCIYWLAQRSVRKAAKGGTLQNAFVFYENSLGYHFKSIDKLIDDVNKQGEEKTNLNTGKTKLYTYVYSTQNADDGSADQFKIATLVFPIEKNFLNGLRHGAWSGFSIGFDPVTVSNSKMGLSTDLSVDAYRYKMKDLWGKMSHLGKKSAKNPLTQMDKDVQAMIDYPKRVRYSMLPNQNFDQKYNSKQQSKQYEELVELQAYQWMRIESFKTFKLQIKIPGNLDLYAGSGINIVIPGTYKKNSKMPIDKKYSGRYVIASVSHQIVGSELTTELMLVKDSTV
jgi:hypothetical protein